MPDQCQAIDVVAIYPQDSLLHLCVVLLQERKGQGNQMKKDHLTSLQTVNGTRSFSDREANLYTSMRSVCMSSNVLQTGPLLTRKKGGVGTHFKKRFRQSSHAREFDFGVQSTPHRSEKLDPQRDASSD